jgi:integrase
MAEKALTERGIETLKAGKADRWIADGAAEGDAGQLVLRVTTAGTKRWFFRYSEGGKRVSLPIGFYGSGGLGLKEARAERDRLRDLRRDPATRDIKDYLRRQEEARLYREEQERQEQERQQQERDAEKHYSLKALMKVYTDHLASKGKQSAKDAATLLRLHVEEAFPHLVVQPAADIEARDVAMVARRLIEAGKERTAGKVRSYLAASFNMALKAETDPRAPAAALGFRLKANPALATAAASGIKERDRFLTETELREYMVRLDTMTAIPEPHRDALRLNLLLAGQRTAQLLRVTRNDVDIKAATITLIDPKGRRERPRRHVLPLLPAALALVEKLMKRADDLSTDKHKVEFLLTSEGKVPIRLETLSKAVADISKSLMAHSQSHEPFRMSDIRRTAETMLASMRISKDVRAQLLSHGLSGVQNKHYDFHDYQPEKIAALRAWERRLQNIRDGQEASNVTALPARRGRR